MIVIVAYLDGIEHAKRRADDRFGPGRLVAVVHRRGRMPPGRPAQLCIGRIVLAVTLRRHRLVQVEQEGR